MWVSLIDEIADTGWKGIKFNRNIAGQFKPACPVERSKLIIPIFGIKATETGWMVFPAETQSLPRDSGFLRAEGRPM
jgi:hypothetical protein